MAFGLKRVGRFLNKNKGLIAGVGLGLATGGVGFGSLAGAGSLGKVGGFLSKNASTIAGLAAPAVGALAGRAVAGDRIDPNDQFAELDALNQQIEADLQAQEELATQRFVSGLTRSSSQSIEDLRAAGLNGSGLGAALGGLMSAHSDVYLSRIAQTASERGRRAVQRNVFGRQDILARDSQLDDRRASTIESFIEGGGAVSDFLLNRAALNT